MKYLHGANWGNTSPNYSGVKYTRTGQTTDFGGVKYLSAANSDFGGMGVDAAVTTPTFFSKYKLYIVLGLGLAAMLAAQKFLVAKGR